MAQVNAKDAVALAQALIRCPSVTPKDAGALDLLENILKPLGFTCTRYPFAEVDNLYARLGQDAPNLCYAGHTDVVPPGDVSKWRYDPFNGEISDGKVWGRGASDMKGGIAAYIAAIANLLAGGWMPHGALSLLITGDEEGPAIHGTKKVLAALQDKHEIIDHCLVGEPTNPNRLGEMIKIGRRGSLNGYIYVTGTQGHVAYPHLADNPVPVLLRLLARLSEKKLDDGNAHFQPSNLEITSVDVSNTAHNVIPEMAEARFNIRFNTEHTGDDLLAWINAEIKRAQAGFSGDIKADLSVPGHPFLTKPCPFTKTLSQAIKTVTHIEPELSTSGGTSDARFITKIAPVAEFGLVGKTIHQINEYAEVYDIETLSEIYKTFLIGYFDA